MTTDSPVAAQSLFAAYAGVIDAALDALVAKDALPAGLARGAVTCEPPRDAAHGDLATNAAMVLAKPAGTNPRALATLLVEELAAHPRVASAEIAGPGFINLRLVDAAWIDELALIGTAGGDYGRSTLGGGTTVNVEYVSANPTGPMHMGHCRGAVVGDALAALLQFAGHKVIKEYYVNDAGAQVDVLARSAHLRYREALGEDVGAVPEGLYPGDYLVPVGQALAAEYGDRYVAAPESEWLVLFRQKAVAAMLVMIKEDLAKLGIVHDLFSSEAELQAAGKPRLPKPGCARTTWSMTATSKRPRARRPKTGSRWNCRCSARPALATTRTARSRSRTGAGPISARTWPITSRRPRPPTRWSISGAPTMPARSSGSRRPSPR
jgi:arginyl-tRNA synthetase